MSSCCASQASQMSGRNSVTAAKKVLILAASVSRLLHHTLMQAAAGQDAKHKILAQINGTIKGVITIKASINKPASASHGTRFLVNRFLVNRLLFNRFVPH